MQNRSWLGLLITFLLFQCQVRIIILLLLMSLQCHFCILLDCKTIFTSCSLIFRIVGADGERKVGEEARLRPDDHGHLPHLLRPSVWLLSGHGASPYFPLWNLETFRQQPGYDSGCPLSYCQYWWRQHCYSGGLIINTHIIYYKIH